MNKNLSISLFGIPRKTIFLFSTILTLLLYGACSSDGPAEAPPEPPTPEPQQQQQTYTVSFNTSGGGRVVSQTQTIVEGETADEPDDPTRDGYRFLNWYSDPDAPSVAYNFTETAVTDDITLYANWVKTFTVTFNTNGGAEEAQQIIDSGMVVTKPTENPSNEAHGGTFEGWYSNEELTADSEYGDDDFDDPVIQNLTLYAKWSYMVSYDETTRTITGLNPALTTEEVDLVIPSNVNGVMMDSIRHNAFYNNTRIVSLKIAEGIKHIGDSAFYGYDRNTFYDVSKIEGDLVIPNSVVTIGNSAFYRCLRFNGSLTIPSSVKTIGDWAFAFCNGFTGSLVIPNSVVTIGNFAFARCSSFTGSLTIGSSVEIIGEWAFDSSGFTGSLTIPDRVETIGEWAFRGCSGFTGSLTISNSVVTIGEAAFSGSGFTGSLTIPNSVVTIGYGAFRNMDRIDNFIFENATPPSSMGEDIFQHIPLTELDIRVPSSAVTTYKGVTNLSQYSERIRATQ